MFRVAKIIAISLLFSSVSLADDHGHHGHRGHHERGHYIPAPQPVPRYYRPDQRSTSGLLGGALGSAMGYEMSKGDPLGAGLGAAAGAWVGNRMY